jgi:hypothetical protein
MKSATTKRIINAINLLKLVMAKLHHNIFNTAHFQHAMLCANLRSNFQNPCKSSNISDIYPY